MSNEERVPFGETRPQAGDSAEPQEAGQEERSVERSDEPNLETLQAQLTAEKRERLMLEENQHKLERMLAASEKAIGELREGVDESKLEELEQRKQQITEAIVQAHANGDVRSDLEYRDQLAAINDEIKTAKQPRQQPAAAPAGPDVMQNPDYKQWLAENPWFGTDSAMSGAALALMNDLIRSERGQKMTPKERFAQVGDEIKRRFGMTKRFAASRVEGGRAEGGYGGGGGTGGGYDELPPDAKRACDNYAKRFVGRKDANGDVKYKTLADYRAHYATDYFDEGWGTKQLSRYQ